MLPPYVALLVGCWFCLLGGPAAVLHSSCPTSCCKGCRLSCSQSKVLQFHPAGKHALPVILVFLPSTKLVIALSIMVDFVLQATMEKLVDQEKDEVSHALCTGRGCFTL